MPLAAATGRADPCPPNAPASSLASLTLETTMPKDKQPKAATAAAKKTYEAKPEARELKEKELEKVAGGTTVEEDLRLRKREHRRR